MCDGVSQALHYAGRERGGEIRAVIADMAQILTTQGSSS
jgi:hypothetical protein